MSRKLAKLLRIRTRLARVAQARLADLERVERERSAAADKARHDVAGRQRTGGRVVTFERLRWADDAAQDAVAQVGGQVRVAADQCRQAASEERRALKLYERARAQQRRLERAKEQRETDDRNGGRR